MRPFSAASEPPTLFTWVGGADRFRYAPWPTRLAAGATAAGVRAVIPGTEVLLQQAAERSG